MDGIVVHTSFIAYGVNYGAPLYFYIVLTLTFISFILISGGIGMTPGTSAYKDLLSQNMAWRCLRQGLCSLLQYTYYSEVSGRQAPRVPISFSFPF